MVSRFQKSRKRAKPERRTKSCIHTKIVLRLRTSDIRLRVIKSATRNDVRLGARSRESKDQICQHALDLQIGRCAAARRRTGMRQVVVDAIKANADRKIRDTDRERDQRIVPGLLRVAQFPDRNGSASTKSEGVGLLGVRPGGQNQLGANQSEADE